MRLLFVVQRYGREVAGGAELHCREFATRLVARGHDVEVLTSCAVSYVDWADRYPPGTEALDGVAVHRLPVVAPRRDKLFGPLNGRVVWAERPVALHVQEEWMRASGPRLRGLTSWLAERAAGFDVVVFFTYLYYPTWAGLPVASGLTTTVLHPTAHDEPPFYLPIFETTFRHPSAFAFSTEEERELVLHRFAVDRPSAIVGIGVDVNADDGVGTSVFRRTWDLGERPYLLYIGRLDPAKGSEELFDFFVAYKRRNPGPLALVMIGDPARPLPGHPEVRTTGIVDDATKRDALAGATAVVQPSFFESFSMVLTEAWAMCKPVLVQGHCAVLEGQVRRSGGGVSYRGFAEFEAALDRLAADVDLRRALGQAGRRFVESRYAWETVLARYEKLLSAVGTNGSMPPRTSVEL